MKNEKLKSQKIMKKMDKKFQLLNLCKKEAEKEFTPNILDIFCVNYSTCKEPIQIVFGKNAESFKNTHSDSRP